MSTTSLPPTESPAVAPPVVPVSLPSGVARHRWTLEEYYKLAEQGWFQDQRVELIEGEILKLVPQGFSHYSQVDAIAELLRERLGQGHWVRQQGSIAVDEYNDPEPDVSVVSGNRRDYTDHPTTAELVVEVAKTSLEYDTKTKPALYARASVAENWVLDLEGEQLWVHRDPVADPTAPGGHRYKTLITLGKDDKVTPLAKRDCEIGVTEMLPAS